MRIGQDGPSLLEAADDLADEATLGEWSVVVAIGLRAVS